MPQEGTELDPGAEAFVPGAVDVQLTWIMGVSICTNP